MKDIVLLVGIGMMILAAWLLEPSFVRVIVFIIASAILFESEKIADYFKKRSK